jgi:hypothetical protein
MVNRACTQACRSKGSPAPAGSDGSGVGVLEARHRSQLIMLRLLAAT